MTRTGPYDCRRRTPARSPHALVRRTVPDGRTPGADRRRPPPTRRRGGRSGRPQRHPLPAPLDRLPADHGACRGTPAPARVAAGGRRLPRHRPTRGGAHAGAVRQPPRHAGVVRHPSRTVPLAPAARRATPDGQPPAGLTWPVTSRSIKGVTWATRPQGGRVGPPKG